jgi:hypothetical protein
VDLSILAPKLRALELQDIKISIFSKSFLVILIKYESFMGTLSLNKTAWMVSSRKQCMRWGEGANFKYLFCDEYN